MVNGLINVAINYLFLRHDILIIFWIGIWKSMNCYNTEIFQKKCEVFGIHLSEEQIEKFMDYYELLTEWNSFMNLTAITDFDEVVLKHFVDSLAIYRADVFRRALKLPDYTVSDIKLSDRKLPDRKRSDEIDFLTREGSSKNLNISEISLIDVGTGAGFPGIPLKIVFENMRITLLDSLNKRVNFLNTVMEKLDLKNVKAVHGRAEDFARQPDYREQYDFCVSRAVANLSTLSELCIPFLKRDGYFISYKSEKVREELSAGKRAVEILGGEIEDILEYQLPDSDMNRSMVLIRKVKSTPKKYPRKAGTPAKEPL